MAVCPNFVLINKILCGYGTMFLEYEEFLQKKARRFHTLVSRATKPVFKTNVIKLSPKAYVKTAHAVCESTKLFLDMERFHDTLEDKIGRFDSRLHRI